MNWLKCLLVLMIGCCSRSGMAQESPADSLDSPVVETVVVPQLPSASRNIGDLKETITGRYAFPTGTPANDRVVIPKLTADVKISNDTAQTQLQFQCVNPTARTVEAPVAVPLPKKAQIPQPSAVAAKKSASPLAVGCELLPAEKALGEWQKMAKQLSHPAPIEFCGSPLLKTDPVRLSARESQPVLIEYHQQLPSGSNRYDYVLPRSESVQNTVPWSLSAEVQADQPIATVYCPSHNVEMKRVAPRSFRVRLDEPASAQPGAFWLSYLLDQGRALSATLFTQPDESTPSEDGTFLFLAGLPAELPEGKTIPREVTLALDRSGSMQGQKIEQVREAATQVIESLNEGEAFNIIAYNNEITSFAEKPVRKTRESLEAALEFIEEVNPRGGTNLHGALLESVKQKPAPQTLPIVLFLTDGLPTVGETAEVKIRDVVAKQNPYRRRIFTVGVGVDVNTPMLESIAKETRAQPTFILPTENVKTRLAQLFEGLESPILADANLEILDSRGKSVPERIRDVYPDPLPDLFVNDHLVVLGRYEGSEPLTFRVRGNYLGTETTVEFTFPLKDQPSHPFVSRLWARQKIANLVQEIRRSGANADPYVILANPTQDAKLKSQAEEILKLTTRYGILTEYTAFLARDTGAWMSQTEQLDTAYQNFDERAVKTRVGLSSVNQSINNTLLQNQFFLNGTNYYWDANMQRVELLNVQQLGDGAFFRRGATWIDARLVDRAELAPQEVVTFGSSEYDELVRRLAPKGEHTPLSLSGNVLMEIDKKAVLIQAPARPIGSAAEVEASTVPKR